MMGLVEANRHGHRCRVFDRATGKEIPRCFMANDITGLVGVYVGNKNGRVSMNRIIGQPETLYYRADIEIRCECPRIQERAN